MATIITHKTTHDLPRLSTVADLQTAASNDEFIIPVDVLSGGAYRTAYASAADLRAAVLTDGAVSAAAARTPQLVYSGAFANPNGWVTPPLTFTDKSADGYYVRAIFQNFDPSTDASAYLSVEYAYDKYDVVSCVVPKYGKNEGAVRQAFGTRVFDFMLGREKRARVQATGLTLTLLTYRCGLPSLTNSHKAVPLPHNEEWTVPSTEADLPGKLWYSASNNAIVSFDFDTPVEYEPPYYSEQYRATLRTGYFENRSYTGGSVRLQKKADGTWTDVAISAGLSSFAVLSGETYRVKAEYGTMTLTPKRRTQKLDDGVWEQFSTISDSPKTFRDVPAPDPSKYAVLCEFRPDNAVS